MICSPLEVLLFNFALMGALPSWMNEKKQEVPVKLSFGLSMGFVAVLYIAIGVIGALALGPLDQGNLFSKINSEGSVGQRPPYWC